MWKSRRNEPVKEGGQQPPQQNLVPGPRAHVAVHELGSGYIHRSTCEEQKRGVWFRILRQYSTVKESKEEGKLLCLAQGFQMSVNI